LLFALLTSRALLHFFFDASRLALGDCAVYHGHYHHSSAGGASNTDHNYDPWHSPFGINFCREDSDWPDETTNEFGFLSCYCRQYLTSNLESSDISTPESQSILTDDGAVARHDFDALSWPCHRLSTTECRFFNAVLLPDLSNIIVSSTRFGPSDAGACLLVNFKPNTTAIAIATATATAKSKFTYAGKLTDIDIKLGASSVAEHKSASAAVRWIVNFKLTNLDFNSTSTGDSKPTGSDRS
jgi:hypothetical protein